jgi:hypothetical protein
MTLMASYSSTMQGPSWGVERAARPITGMSSQPVSGPK